MKYEIKDVINGGYCLYKYFDTSLIDLGDIHLMKEAKKSFSYCHQNDNCFNYHGIQFAFTGLFLNPNYFTPKRILVIQMK